MDIKSTLNLQAYEFQLTEVESRLARQPDNVELQRLAEKLRTLIALTSRSAGTKSDSSKGELESATSSKISISSPSPCMTTFTPKNADSPIPTTIAATTTTTITPTTTPTTAPAIRVGQLCEARCFSSNGNWYEAVIQSITADCSSCMVVFTGTAEAQQCSLCDIRPYDHLHTKQMPALPIALASNSKTHQTTSTAGGGVLPTNTSPSNVNTTDSTTSAPTAKRRRADRREYIQRKEEEQREKQQSWKAFSEKLGKVNTQATLKAGLRKESIFSTKK